jgi:hypothetical protein
MIDLINCMLTQQSLGYIIARVGGCLNELGSIKIPSLCGVVVITYPSQLALSSKMMNGNPIG